MSEIGSLQPLAPGTLIQEFKILRPLGEGAFAIVYLAENQYLPETVAIKEFFHAELAQRMSDGTVTPRSPAAEETFRWALDKFLVEAQILYELGQGGGHPNIVRVRRFHEANGTAYMVMDFEEGEPLEDRLEREGTLSEQDLMPILTPLLDALDWAHSKSVWHRDIKPANIFIRPDGSPVLFDFGAARKDRGDGAVSQIAVFTPNYAAPEQEGGLADSMGPWTDIYSLGATLYRAVVGRLPTNAHHRALDAEHVSAVQAAAGKGYTDVFLAAIDRALELSPAKRPQSVAEWRRDFEGLSAIAQPLEGGDTVLRPSPRMAAAAGDGERVAPSSVADQGSLPERNGASGGRVARPPERSSPGRGRSRRRLAYVVAGVVVIGVAMLGTFAFLDGQSVLEKSSESNDTGLRDPASDLADRGEVTTDTPPVTVADVVNGLAPDVVRPSLPPIANDRPRYVPPARSEPKAVAGPPAELPRGSELASIDRPRDVPPAQSEPKAVAKPQDELPRGSEPASNDRPRYVPPAQSEPKAIAKPPAELPRGSELASIDRPRYVPPAQSVPKAIAEPQGAPPPGSKLAKLEPLTPALSAPSLDGVLAAAQRLADDMECSSLAVSLSNDSRLELIGFVMTQGDLDGLVSRLLALDGVKAVQNDVRVVARPFCQALQILVADTLGAADGPVIDLENSDGTYREGQFLQLTAVASSAFDGYLYVDYIDGEGNVLHFLPSPRLKNNRVTGGQKLLLGRKPKFMVAPPHGQSMFLAISSEQPLFDEIRPEIESEGQYLPALEARLKALPAQAKEGRRITSSTRFIVTTP